MKVKVDFNYGAPPPGAGLEWACRRRCGLCGSRHPAHAFAWVSTGDGTRHGYRYNDRDRLAGRSLCGRRLPRDVRSVGGIHGGARNCKGCLRAARTK